MESDGPKKIKNTELWEKTKQEPISRVIKIRKWKWIGHTLRIDKNNITRQSLEWNPQGKRKRGRPRNTWRRNITTELKNVNTTWEEIKNLAQNRVRWRAFVAALCPPWDEVD